MNRHDCAETPAAPALKGLFASPLIAGFECGLVHGGRHDLLVTTRHLASGRMAEHLRLCRDHGMRTIRDGLVPGHAPGPRLEIARGAGVEAIWDLSHFHRIDDPVAHARSAVQAALAVAPDARLWLCPVNEPSLYPRMAGMARHEAIDLAITMARVARDHHPDVGILTNDPIVGIGARQFEATDAIIAAVPVDVVGVNYYPHTAATRLSKVLLKTWRRYGRPVMLSETSWHDGHPVHHRRYPGFHKGAWLRHVRDEMALAQQSGAVLAGCCWYPIVDCPPWDRPRSRRRWSHGLIRSDLSLDAALCAEIALVREELDGDGARAAAS